MATSSEEDKKPLKQLTEEDKTDAKFLVRLLTEPGPENDKMRKKIYDELIANPKSANEFNIINYEQIMTAIAGNYDKEENILEEAVDLMILVFQDYSTNTAAKFKSIVKRMTENADKFVQAAGGKLPKNPASSNPFHAQASIVFEKLAVTNPEQVSKFYEPRPVEPAGVVVTLPESEPPSLAALPDGTVVATSRAPLGGPPESDPSKTASAASLLATPPVQPDPRIAIYKQALEQIKQNLEKINIYKGNYTVDLGNSRAPAVFDSQTFFAHLLSKERLINQNLVELIAPAADPAADPSFPNFTKDKISGINTEINQYIDKVKELNKIKEAVRHLYIDSNIYFFQFSFLQTPKDISEPKNPIRDEANETIREIKSARDKIIKALLTEQMKAKGFIVQLDSIELPKSNKTVNSERASENTQILKIFNTISPIVDSLNKKLRGIIQPPKLTDVDKAEKERIFKALPTLRGSIMRQSVKSNFVKEIKSEILTIIFEEMKMNSTNGKPGKTAEASTAVEKGNKLSIDVKNSAESIVETAATMLNYADQVSLAKKLVIYVQKIINKIRDTDFLAEKFMDLLKEDKEPVVLFKPPLPVVAEAPPSPRVITPAKPAAPSSAALTDDQIRELIAAINGSKVPIEDSNNRFTDYNFKTTDVENIKSDLVQLKSYLVEFKTGVQRMSTVEESGNLEILRETNPDDANKFDDILSKRNNIIANLVKATSDIVKELELTFADFNSKADAYDALDDADLTKASAEEAASISYTLADGMIDKCQVIINELRTPSIFKIISDEKKQNLSENNNKIATVRVEIKARANLKLSTPRPSDDNSSLGSQSSRDSVSTRSSYSSTNLFSNGSQSSRGSYTTSGDNSARDLSQVSNRSNTGPLSSRSPVLTTPEENKKRFDEILTDIEYANTNAGDAIFNETRKQSIMRKLDKLMEKSSGTKTFGLTVFTEEDEDYITLRSDVEVYEGMLEEAEEVLLKFVGQSEHPQLLSRLEPFVTSYKPYKDKFGILDYRIKNPQIARKYISDGSDTPRAPRALRASGGGTRRGGKRFHKKTIKNNLVHKKTFKKNIVNNKIVHKKTGKNNIVKNNIVKNNIVKNNIEIN